MPVNCSMKGDLDCCGTLKGKIYAPTWVNAYELAVQEGFEGTEEEWLASLRGADGKPGENGKSAYELAVEEGFDGTLDEWLDSLSPKNLEHEELQGRDKPNQHPIDAITDLPHTLEEKADWDAIPDVLTATYQDIMDAYDIWAKGVGVKS